MIREESLQTLEFDKILNAISKFSNSDASLKSILEICPLYNREDIEKRFGQIMEIQKLSQEGTPLKISQFQDIYQLIEKLKPEDSVLEPIELIAFWPVLQIIYDVSSQIRNRYDLPLLNKMTEHLTGFPEITDIMERSLDGSGNILDNASSMLFDLRIRIRKLDFKINKRGKIFFTNIETFPSFKKDSPLACQ